MLQLSVKKLVKNMTSSRWCKWRGNPIQPYNLLLMLGAPQERVILKWAIINNLNGKRDIYLE